MLCQILFLYLCQIKQVNIMTHQELKKRLISIGWKLYSIRGEINTSSMYKAKGYRITYAKVLGPHTMSAQATRWIESESYEDILYFFTT